MCGFLLACVTSQHMEFMEKGEYLMLCGPQ